MLTRTTTLVQSPIVRPMLWLAFLLALLAALLASSWLVPRSAAPDDGSPQQIVLGRREPVRLSTLVGEGEQAEGEQVIDVQAKIDTGADSSSIDTSLAEQLGIDLSKADTIKVVSALGEERRPVVPLRLEVTGRPFDIRVTVTNRSQRTSKMLLGERDLEGFLVDVTRKERTAPVTGTPDTPLERVLTFGFAPVEREQLLTALPLAVVVVVACRTLIGLLTFGIFAPLLLALAFVRTGFLTGILIFSAMVAIGALALPLLRPFQLPRIARLAVLLTLVVVMLHALHDVFGRSVVNMTLPVVVTATFMEQFWNTLEQESLRSALMTGFWTFVVAIVAAVLLSANAVQFLSANHPYLLAAVGILLTIAVGSYRGLRLLEVRRFAPAAGRRVTA